MLQHRCIEQAADVLCFTSYTLIQSSFVGTVSDGNIERNLTMDDMRIVQFGNGICLFTKKILKFDLRNFCNFRIKLSSFSCLAFRCICVPSFSVISVHTTKLCILISSVAFVFSPLNRYWSWKMS